MFNPELEGSWQARLSEEFDQGYMHSLTKFLREQNNAGANIYPPAQQIFAAFSATPFYAVKVVILGQDPYHGPGQAHGLSFSVPIDARIPPSLRNIFTEMTNDLGIERPTSGNLDQWARRGVLLLNACLTVEDNKAGAHQGKGWEIFTDRVITELNDNRTNLVFVLWGRKAQEKGRAIDRQRHLVIESPHPSPLSAHNGFYGTKPFSRANNYLQENGITPIEWRI